MPNAQCPMGFVHSRFVIRNWSFLRHYGLGISHSFLRLPPVIGTRGWMSLSRHFGLGTSFFRCWLCCVPGLALLMAGCDKEGIRVYRVPREQPAMASSPAPG